MHGFRRISAAGVRLPSPLAAHHLRYMSAVRTVPGRSYRPQPATANQPTIVDFNDAKTSIKVQPPVACTLLFSHPILTVYLGLLLGWCKNGLRAVLLLIVP